MVLLTKYNGHTNCLFIFFAGQPGVGIGDVDGQLGCFVHSDFELLRGVVSSLSTAARQQLFNLFDLVDQELLKVTGKCVLCCLIAPITSVGRQDPTLESSVHPVVSASGFLN